MSIPLNGYIVHAETAESVATGQRTLSSYRVDAAYYKAEDHGFTSFKDGDHKDVFTVRNDLLASVSRIAVDIDALTLTVQDLLDTADTQDKAVGSHSRSEVLPDGRVIVTDYEITVKAVCESTKSPSQPLRRADLRRADEGLTVDADCDVDVR